MDNALCGGAGATLTGTALAAVKAAIFMGDPHNRAGLPYNVGTCTAQGVRWTPNSPLHSANEETVRCPPRRLPVLARQHLHHPVILRCCRPILLHRQRCQHPPAVRQQVRLPSPCFHQEQDHRIDGHPDETNQTWKDARKERQNSL